MEDKKEPEVVEEDGWDKPYKCGLCDERVNFTFILPFLKNSGLCPDCYWKDNE